MSSQNEEKYVAASLSPDQLDRLQQLEKELGAVLIAYEQASSSEARDKKYS